MSRSSDFQIILTGQPSLNWIRSPPESALFPQNAALTGFALPIAASTFIWLAWGAAVHDSLQHWSGTKRRLRRRAKHGNLSNCSSGDLSRQCRHDVQLARFGPINYDGRASSEFATSRGYAVFYDGFTLPGAAGFSQLELQVFAANGINIRDQQGVAVPVIIDIKTRRNFQQHQSGKLWKDPTSRNLDY
jgi:hypothetical protein